MKGYKVVTDRGYPAGHQGGRILTSLIVDDYRASVRYEIGITARRKDKCGPLCVFRHLVDARAIACWGYNPIFKCNYKPSRCVIVWGPAENEPSGVHRCPINNLYNGTVLAEEVTLLEEVKT